MGDSGLWAMVGMAAIMGGTMRSPLTAVIFTVELTNDFNVLPALLIACVASEAVTVLLLRRSILTEKVARRGFHLIREYSVDPLQLVRVSEVMDSKIEPIRYDMPLSILAERMAENHPQFSRHHAFPIVDALNNIIGIITRGDVLRAMNLHISTAMTVLEAGTSTLVTVFPDDILSDAVTKMLNNDIGRLLVVSREDPAKLIGYIGRPAILSARMKMHEEEHVREPGALKKSGTFCIRLYKIFN